MKQLARLVNYAEKQSHKVYCSFVFFYGQQEMPLNKNYLNVLQWKAILQIEEEFIRSEDYNELEEALENLIEACLKQGWNVVDAVAPEEIAYFAKIERFIQLLQEKLLTLEGCDSLFFEYVLAPTFSLPKWSGSIDCGSHWQSRSIAEASGENLLTICEELLKQLQKP